MGVLNDTVQNTYMTNSTETATVVSYSIPSNCYGSIKVTVLAQDESSNNTIGSIKQAIIKRKTDSVSQVGLESIIIDSKDTVLLTASYDFAYSGSTLEFNVTGVLGLNIDWLVKMELFLEGNF